MATDARGELDAPSQYICEHSSIRNKLLDAWPDHCGLETMIELSADKSGVFHSDLCASIAKIGFAQSPSAHEIIQKLRPGLHPARIARKLLALASYLQGLPLSRVHTLSEAGIDVHAVMALAFWTAQQWVTSNERLLDSMEGVECLFIESVYQNNAGNLRSAWHVLRRAMLIGQIIGIHRAGATATMTCLDPETRARIHPEQLSFRLHQMDGYLTLMPGMPQSSPNKHLADADVLERCTPAERMKRMDSVVGGHILQRNETRLYDSGTTLMTEQMLQRSAACVSTS